MPTYEYRCPKCGTEFEAFQKITAKPAAQCPKCGAKAKRLMSAGAGLVFKGSGFYLTDYGRSGQKAKEAKAESEHKASSSEKPSEKPTVTPAPSESRSKPRKKDG